MIEGKHKDEENTSNSSSAHFKKKGGDNKFKGSKKNHGKIDLSKIECYHCHKMWHYDNQFRNNPKNKKREMDQATTSSDENPLKKCKTDDSEVKYLFY